MRLVTTWRAKESFFRRLQLAPRGHTSRLKQRLKVDSFGRLYVPGWRKNSATERRVFDAIDRAFSSLTTFGRVYSMTRPCRCSNTRSSMTVEAATQSETLLRPSSMRRQRSCPPCGRTRRDSQMGTPHRTPSLDVMSLGRGQAEHSTDGDKLCQDSDRSCSNDTVSSGQSKLQRQNGLRMFSHSASRQSTCSQTGVKQAS